MNYEILLIVLIYFVIESC